MKKTLIAVLVILFFSGLSSLRMGFSRTGKGERNTDDFTGFFVLRDESPLRVSIDHGWERDGWIPVFFAFRDMEIGLRVKARDLEAGAGLSTSINELLVEDMNLPFLVYEQNHMRTRMELLEGKPLQLKINPKGRVEIFLGSSRLILEPNPLRADFEEIETAPGELYQLTFTGQKVSTHRKYVFMPSRGVIYAGSPHSTLLTLNSDTEKNADWTVWAVRIDPEETEEENIIKEDQVK